MEHAPMDFLLAWENWMIDATVEGAYGTCSYGLSACLGELDDRRYG